MKSIILAALTVGTLDCRPVMNDAPWFGARPPSCIEDQIGESPITATFEQRWPKLNEQMLQIRWETRGGW